MKIAVISFSGNVGKTMLARQLLAPRMKAVEIAVETINAGASDNPGNVERLRATEFSGLQAQLLAHESVIVDIGASNVQKVIKQLGRFEGPHEDFDFYVVPVVCDDKQMQDTITTIQTLAALGIPAQKIRIVFNRIEVDDLDDLRGKFGVLFALQARDRSFMLNPRAAILENEVFGLLRPLRKSLAEVFADQTDYRKLYSELTDPEAKAAALEMLLAKRLATAATRNLDAVFAELFKKERK